MDRIAYSVIASGNAGFLRAFPIPLAEALENIDGLDSVAIPKSTVFFHDKEPKAIDVSVSAVFGLLLLLPGWLAWKIIDEVYEIKIKPSVIKVIQKADSIKLFSKNKKHAAFMLKVYNTEANTLIILAAIASSHHHLAEAAENLPNFLPNALHFASNNKSTNEVHLYVLREGKINLIPEIHENTNSAFRSINT
jgi:hypothetical protein